MKTAVSIPDELFRMAEAVARRMRVSRSELYATAISELLKRQQGGAVTERLNEAVCPPSGEGGCALHRAQMRSIEKDSW